MIIAYEMPAISAVSVQQGAMLGTNGPDLYDGRPGTAVAFQTPASTGQTLRFTMNLGTSIPLATADYLLIRIDNVRASFVNVPQVAVTLTGPGTSIAAAQVVVSPASRNASRSILLPRSFFGASPAAVSAIRLDITNAVASAQVSVGDVFISRAYEVPVDRLTETPVDPSVTRRSSGNQPWPLVRLPFRRVDAAFVNQSYRDAFLDSTIWPLPGNLRNLMFGAARATKLGIVTRWRYDHSRPISQPMVDVNTMLARLVDMNGFEGQAGNDRWPLSAVFEESL
ncbi:hypothetical protein ACQQ2N_12065 [Dokdonella sp. MW10]|uniref:hypothetical protein n=1 Tax=Dokdonella sp. MW10 TaxID=2992926 RepID=UPI003F8195CB